MRKNVTVTTSTVSKVKCALCPKTLEFKDMREHEIENELMTKHGWKVHTCQEYICQDCHAKKMKEWETSGDIRDRIAAGVYQTKKEYATRKENAAKHEEYQKDCARLNDLFRKDALESVGLTGHPKADKAFAYAYEQGHSAGDFEILNYLEGIITLID